LKEIIYACWKADAPLKARSTYVESKKVLGAIGPDGRLHPGHNSVGTETGRWSCKDPNLYNLSEQTKEEDGDLRGDLPNIRSMYVAGKGNVIVHGDFKQLELEVMADYTGDAALRRMCETGDVHNARVREWFSVGADQGIPKMLRRQGKVVGFAAQYGAGVETVFLAVLEKIQDARFEEIAALHELFPRKHPGIKAHWERSLEFARRCGYNETFIMRRRRYYPPGLEPPQVTDTSNYAIQGTAADIQNCMLVGKCADPRADLEIGRGAAFVDALAREYPKAWLACQTYDSVDVIVPKKAAEGVKALLETHMAGPWDLGAGPRKLKADIKIGERWSEV